MQQNLRDWPGASGPFGEAAQVVIPRNVRDWDASGSSGSSRSPTSKPRARGSTPLRRAFQGENHGDLEADLKRDARADRASVTAPGAGSQTSARSPARMPRAEQTPPPNPTRGVRAASCGQLEHTTLVGTVARKPRKRLPSGAEGRDPLLW